VQQRKTVTSQAADCRGSIEECFAAAGLVGASTLIKELHALVSRVSASHQPALIDGEPGTGNESVARAIHAQGPRGGQPFVLVECAGLVHEARDARQMDMRSSLRKARGGTLFLKDVDALTPEAQGQLLGMLVATNAPDPTENQVRVISATNCDLAARVRQGLFRSDLFFRLDVLRVRIPSLRERREDIPVVAQAILGTLASRWNQRALPGLTSEALGLLCGPYGWPGNQRELELALTAVLANCGTDKLDGGTLRGLLG
jgi:DNA-binding NtrC family response regulator